MPKGTNRTIGRCELWIARTLLKSPKAGRSPIDIQIRPTPHRGTSLRLSLKGGSQLGRGGRRRFTSEVRLGVVEAPAVTREKALTKLEAVTVNEGTMEESASKAGDNGEGKDLKRKHSSSGVEARRWWSRQKQDTAHWGVGRGGGALHRRGGRAHVERSSAGHGCGSNEAKGERRRSLN